MSDPELWSIGLDCPANCPAISKLAHSMGCRHAERWLGGGWPPPLCVAGASRATPRGRWGRCWLMPQLERGPWVVAHWSCPRTADSYPRPEPAKQGAWGQCMAGASAYHSPHPTVRPSWSDPSPTLRLRSLLIPLGLDCSWGGWGVGRGLRV